MVDSVDTSCGGAKVDGYGFTGAPAVGGQMSFSSYHGTTLEGGGRRRKARRSARRSTRRSSLFASRCVQLATSLMRDYSPSYAFCISHSFLVYNLSLALRLYVYECSVP